MTKQFYKPFSSMANQAIAHIAKASRHYYTLRCRRENDFMGRVRVVSTYLSTLGK